MTQFISSHFIRALCVLFTALYLFSAHAEENDLLAEGQAAFNASEFKRSFEIWHDLATQGLTDAQVLVGLAYKNSWGVTQNLERSAMWFQMAAEGGNASAQFFLGLHYVSVKNPQLVPVGVDWLVKAAENGDASAKQFLIKARIKRWFEVPSTLNIKVVTTKVTADDINKELENGSAVAQNGQISSEKPITVN